MRAARYRSGDCLLRTRSRSKSVPWHVLRLDRDPDRRELLPDRRRENQGCRSAPAVLEFFYPRGGPPQHKGPPPPPAREKKKAAIWFLLGSNPPRLPISFSSVVQGAPRPPTPSTE